MLGVPSSELPAGLPGIHTMRGAWCTTSTSRPRALTGAIVSTATELTLMHCHRASPSELYKLARYLHEVRLSKGDTLIEQMCTMRSWLNPLQMWHSLEYSSFGVLMSSIAAPLHNLVDMASIAHSTVWHTADHT
eukprot:scaffold133899_cov22-Tisochrysis_lutea.AAC.1